TSTVSFPSHNWLDLPEILWYYICEHLSVIDIVYLSQTNQKLYQLINTDPFWIHLIRTHFGQRLWHLYCNLLFHQTNTTDLLYKSTHNQQEFERQYKQLPPTILRTGWTMAITAAQNNNIKGFAAAKRAKFYFPKLKHQLKMAITEKTFRSHLIFYEFNNEKLISFKQTVLLSKLVYFYLLDRKRLPVNSMFTCFDNLNLHPLCEKDSTSISEYVAHVDYKWLSAVRGSFIDVIPGEYQIVVRMKLDIVRYELQREDDNFSGEFTCIPEYGLMSNYTWDGEWFEMNYALNDKNWFEHSMGTITVYELSEVYFGMRVWMMPYKKYQILCDYIELKIVQ
ncbi:unnamed protein product, partial [Didymodactylos carnosus]